MTDLKDSFVTAVFPTEVVKEHIFRVQEEYGKPKMHAPFSESVRPE
jgi:hypothetical protein